MGRAHLLSSLFFVKFVLGEDLICYRNNTALDRVPNEDIPYNVTVLILRNNRLYADQFTLYPFLDLVHLDLGHNNFVSFPNLINVSSSLEILHMDSNGMEVIDAEYLDKLKKITKLYLHSNPIQAIPDVPGPSQTLRFLELSCQYCAAFGITELPHLKQLGKSLETIHLNYFVTMTITAQNLYTVPKLTMLEAWYVREVRIEGICSLSRTLPLTFELGWSTLVCDVSSGWLKVAEAAGIVQFNYPSTMSVCGQRWVDVTPDDLLRKDTSTCSNRHQILYRRQLITSTCPLKIISRHAATPPGVCAMLCLCTPHCFMFAVDSNTCALTDGQIGTAQEMNEFSHWYNIDKSFK